MTKLINKNKLNAFANKFWDKIKARDISSFVYSTDKATNTKTLKAKRADGALGDININIDDLASQTLNNTFDGENIFKDIYIKDTVLTYVNNENATFFMGGENQYSAVKELVVSANTYVSSIVIALKDDLAIGAEVTGINVGTISTDNVVLEHLITRGTGRVEANSYSVLSSNKVVVVPINRSFGQDIYFMIGAKGMLWNSGTGYHVIGGNDMPRPNATVYPNGSNYFGKIAIIGKGASLKERFGNMAKVNEFNSFTATNNFRKILFEDGYLNTAILSKIDNPRATTPSNSNNVYSASPAFRVQANTFVDKIIIGLSDDIEVDAEVTGINVGTVSTDNIVLEHLIKQGRARAIANTYSEISCSKIISVPINKYFNQDVYFMIGAKGMLWNEARYAGVTAAGGENGMPNAGTRLSPNSTNYVGKFLMIGQGLSIKESFEKAINTYNTVNQATSVGGNDHVGKLVKLSNNGKLDPSILPAGQNGGVRTVNNQSPNENGNVTVLADHIKYANGQDITVKGAIDNKPNTVNGRGVNRNDGNITIYSDNIDISSSNPKKISQVLDEKLNKSEVSNSGNNVPRLNNGKLVYEILPDTVVRTDKDNVFRSYCPKVNRTFTMASFNVEGYSGKNFEVFQNESGLLKYVCNYSAKFNNNTSVTHLIIPIKNGQVGDRVEAIFFVINNDNRVIQVPTNYKSCTVEDIDMVGCKCIRLPVGRTFNERVAFGFSVVSRNINGRRIGLAYATDSSYNSNVWIGNTPNSNMAMSNNSPHYIFPFKIGHETTSELVTRFELEKVTQIYPRTLIGEYKNLSYDAGNSLDDGTNTWLRANGQAINSNDYPELYEKFNTSRTDDDIEVSIPAIDNQVGYYYICAK